jgi:DNA-binding GntR family transcriptional regulator
VKIGNHVETSQPQPLDRSSAVPLYYQLQEILKQQIESGQWQPGEAIPPEMELARDYGVSRVCVRQALAILEDDREIVRVQGRGTFVASRKLTYRPTGLAGLVTGPERPVAVRVLDKRVGGVERAIASSLESEPEAILRLTTLWSISDTPFGIGLSFFRAADVPWLAEGIEVGSALRGGRPVAGLELEDTQISLETTQCGQFEADLLGIPNRSTLLLTVSVVHAGGRPFEVMRYGYRGDIVQLRLHDTRRPDDAADEGQFMFVGTPAASPNGAR